MAHRSAPTARLTIMRAPSGVVRIPAHKGGGANTTVAVNSAIAVDVRCLGIASDGCVSYASSGEDLCWSGCPPLRATGFGESDLESGTAQATKYGPINPTHINAAEETNAAAVRRRDVCGPKT